MDLLPANAGYGSFCRKFVKQFPAGFGPFDIFGGWFPAYLGDNFTDYFLILYDSRLYRFDFGGHVVTSDLNIPIFLDGCKQKRA
jgi:hypothetical protein